MTPLRGQALIEVAADYILDDPGTSYQYLYDRLIADHDIRVSRRSFVSGGYATAAKRLAETRAAMNTEPEVVPEPSRPTAPEIPPPSTALTPAQLAWGRQEFRRRQREREEAREARRRAERERRAKAFRRPKLRSGKVHPFAQDFQVGRKRRTKPGEHLPPVEYLPASEWLQAGAG